MPHNQLRHVGTEGVQKTECHLHDIKFYFIYYLYTENRERLFGRFASFRLSVRVTALLYVGLLHFRSNLLFIDFIKFKIYGCVFVSICSRVCENVFVCVDDDFMIAIHHSWFSLFHFHKFLYTSTSNSYLLNFVAFKSVFNHISKLYYIHRECGLFSCFFAEKYQNFALHKIREIVLVCVAYWKIISWNWNVKESMALSAFRSILILSILSFVCECFIHYKRKIHFETAFCWAVFRSVRFVLYFSTTELHWLEEHTLLFPTAFAFVCQIKKARIYLYV